MPDPVTVQALVKWHREQAATIGAAKGPRPRAGSAQYAAVQAALDVSFHYSAADLIERLAGALEPFAAVLAGNYSHQSDDLPIAAGHGPYDLRWTLTLGHFRRARQALHPGEPNG